MVLPRPLTVALLAVAGIAGAAPLSLLCPALQHPSPTTQIQTAGEPLDINTATAAQLNALPGFGPVYTRRVIAGRPYSAKNQLLNRGILPTDEYERIAALIVAHRIRR